MEDKTQPEEPKKEVKPLSIVEEAAKIRDEIRAENDRRENLLKEEQRMRANDILGGSSGGHVEPEKPKEESARDYMKRVMSGGLNKHGEE